MGNDLFQFVFDFFIDELIESRHTNNTDKMNDILPILFRFWLINSDQTRRAIVNNCLRQFYKILRVQNEISTLIKRDEAPYSSNWFSEQKTNSYNDLEHVFFDGFISTKNAVKERFFEIITSIVPDRALNK